MDTTGEHGIVVLVDQRSATTAPRTFSLDPPSPGALLRAIDALCRISGVPTPRFALRGASRGPHSALRAPRGKQGSGVSFHGIDVVPGPGRFSRVRLGVVTANALAWALGIPLVVRGRRVRIAQPEYGAAPHIG